MKTNKFYLLLLSFFFLPIFSFGQSTGLKLFFSLRWPEKWWVITHPCSVRSVYQISKETQQRKERWKIANLLDGDENGGQLDAMRHVYWMARLGQEIPIKAARKLGKAHERSNKIHFKKHKQQFFLANDEKSSEMDLLNNEVGLQLAMQHPDTSKDSLVIYVKQLILNGKAYVIKKNKRGDFLDASNNLILKKDVIGKWENQKVLVPSNYGKKLF